jgi:ketosteroid isomerase-like protein
MKKYCALLAMAGAIFFYTSCEDNTKTTTADNNLTDTAAATFDIGKARDWINNDNRKFEEEVRKGDSNALAAHYSSDGMLMFANSEPFKGTGIASAWGGAIRMGMKDLKITTEDLTGGPEVLAVTGTYEMYGANNKLLDKGKYIVVWKRDNGGWKIYRDMGNSSMPMARK